MEQEPRICPLCGSPVRLFFINFSEKLLMCEDPNCDFPFGYEELQIVTDESQLRENFDTASSISLGPYNGMSAASSIISTAAWSDIERLNRIYDSEDGMADSRMSFTSDAVKQQKERRKNQAEIQKNVDTIKKLNTELNILKHADKASIQKNDWLKNLMNLQGLSGRQLLKKEEIEKLKKQEADFGMGELKINIHSEPNEMGIINIEIINDNDENKCDTDKSKKQINEINEDSYNDDENHNDKINQGINKEAITSHNLTNTDPNIQEIENNENTLIDNNINLEALTSSDMLTNLDINFDEINNLVTDSDINYDDINLIDVKTVVIKDNSVTLIELKSIDSNTPNECENIKDIQIDSTDTTIDLNDISINEINEENNNSNPSQQQDIEGTQNDDVTVNNSTEINEDNPKLNGNNIEANVNDSNYNSENTININKTADAKINENERLQDNNKIITSNMKHYNFITKRQENIDIVKALVKCKKEINEKEVTKINDSKDDKDIMNHSIGSDIINDPETPEIKIPKKRGRKKKGTKILEHPLRRSSRLSK